jgi:hypothetical protein
MLNHNWFNYKSGKKLTKIENFLVYPFSKFLFRLIVLISIPIGLLLGIIDLILLPIHGIFYLFFGKSKSLLTSYLDFVSFLITGDFNFIIL